MRLACLFSLCLLLAAPTVAQAPEKPGARRAVDELCAWLDTAFPAACYCEINASPLVDYLKKNGMPASLCPVLAISHGAGADAKAELKFPQASPFIAQQAEKLLRKPADTMSRSVLKNVIAVINPKALAAALRSVLQRAGEIELRQGEVDGQRCQVVDLAELYMPASAVGHVLRLKLWIGPDGRLHQVYVYTSLHGIFRVRPSYATLKDKSGKSYTVVRRITSEPMLSEFEVTPTNPWILDFKSYRILDGEKDKDQAKEPGEKEGE